MKTVETLFDTEPFKEPKIQTPLGKLRTALLKDFNASIYSFKIKYNRVFYGKVENMPKNVTKEQWLNVAEKIWADKEADNKTFVDYRGKNVKVNLLDVTKANQ